MADSKDPPPASDTNMAKPSDAPTDPSSAGQDREGQEHKNPRHSGHKRSRMGKKEKGRADWQ